MEIIEFLKNWYQRKSEVVDTELTADDKFFKIGGYLFVVQKDGNVLLKKIDESKFSIKEAFRAFRFFLIKEKIQYIRIEGRKNQYSFLKKMFPTLRFVSDDEVKNRDVFFVRVYE